MTLHGAPAMVLVCSAYGASMLVWARVWCMRTARRQLGWERAPSRWVEP